jgi:hypothetical protein
MLTITHTEPAAALKALFSLFKQSRPAQPLRKRATLPPHQKFNGPVLSAGRLKAIELISFSFSSLYFSLTFDKNKLTSVRRLHHDAHGN